MPTFAAVPVVAAAAVPAAVAASPAPVAAVAPVPVAAVAASPAPVAASPVPVDVFGSRREALSADGIVDVDGLITSYQNLRAVTGKDTGVVRIPDPNNNEQVAAFKQTLGRPATPDGYEFTSFTGDENKQFVDAYRNKAFEMGLNKVDANGMLEWVNALSETTNENNLTSQRDQIAGQEAQLVKDWGNDFEQKKALALSATSRLNLTQEGFNDIYAALGPQIAMELFSRVGEITGEHQTVNNPGVTTISTPESAKEEMARLSSEPTFREALINASHPNHSSVTAQWQALGEQRWGTK